MSQHKDGKPLVLVEVLVALVITDCLCYCPKPYDNSHSQSHMKAKN
jgi:hypothetical protein